MNKHAGQPLTCKMALNIAAPHTWAASVMPVLLGAALTLWAGMGIEPLLFSCLMLISVLMQSAVNALNDYHDFIKGTDTVENCDDPFDAVLVYNNISPRSVQLLGCSFLAIAGLLGIYVVARAGFIPLLIGLVGAAVVILYSAGKIALSYLPVGELVSGFVMGGLITLATTVSLGGISGPGVIIHAAPLIVGIAMIMFTNNLSDIERDLLAKRRTLAVCLGRQAGVAVYRVMVVLWLLLIVYFVLRDFSAALWLLPLALIISASTAWQLVKLPFTASVRGQAMPGIIRLNIIANGSYIVMILACAAR